MPYAISIPLTTSEPLRPALPQQRAMHAIFLAALQTADPALSAAVHDRPVKPFTQALLPAGAPERYTWRVTLLDDRLRDPLRAGLGQLKPDRLHDRQFELDLAGVHSEHRSYEELAGVATSYRYRLAFRTPTTFKQSNRHQPLPDPYRCFQSWWNRWLAFAPAELAINIALLDIIAEHVATSRFKLRSRLWSDGPRRLVGAVGELEMLVLGRHKLEESWWQEASALFAYAAFCGTGHKTTVGLGQTAVYPTA